MYVNKQDNLEDIKIKGIKHRQARAERGLDLLMMENSEIIHNNNVKALLRAFLAL